MQRFFQKLFHIFPGEEKNAIYFGILGFCWALAVSSGLKFSDALFLLHVGAESLPIAYIFTALGMFSIAFILIKKFDTVSVHRIYNTAIIAGLSFYTLALVCYLNEWGVESHLLWFSLRIFGSIFFSVMVTCYWTFIDQYHSLQVAKRLYSLFTSMTFLGIATTGVIMRSGVIDFQYLLMGVVAILTFCSFWIHRITTTIKPVSELSDWEGSASQGSSSFKALIQTILNSRFTLLLMSANFVTYLLLVLTEYNYMLSFDNYFDPGTTTPVGQEEDARLTLFLGQCIAVVSIANLLFGLFIYSRLVKRFGSSSLLIVTPTILLITFAGWPLSDSLIFPLMGFLVVEGTLYVIDDNNFNLLLNAVPVKVKYKIRIIIESFFEPIGMLISAILLSIPWVNSKWIGLFLSLALLTIALLLRSRYFKAIYLNLKENAIHFEKSVYSWFEKMTTKEYRACEYRLLSIMRYSDLPSQTLAAEALVDMEDPAILKRLMKEVDKLPTSAKIKFLEYVSLGPFSQDPVVLDHLYQWYYEDFDPVLTSEVKFYLARKGLFHPEKAILDLNSNDLLSHGAAILALEKPWPHLSARETNENRMLAAQALQELLHSSDEQKVTLALTIMQVDAVPQEIELFIPFLKNPSLNIARAAAKAIAQLSGKAVLRYASILTTELHIVKDNQLKLALLEALGKMNDPSLVQEIISASLHFRPNESRFAEKTLVKMGLRIVPLLLSLVKDMEIHDKGRLLAGKTLGRLALPQLRANLKEIVQREVHRAYFYYYYAKTIQESNPGIDLSILETSLLSSYHSVLDFIIQLLGVAGEIEDVELLARSMRSPNPKVRSQVIETLEKTCETQIYRLIQPLVSDVPYEEKIKPYISESSSKMNLEELLQALTESSSQLDHIIAATLQHRLNLPHWRSMLIKQMTTKEEIFQHFAYELLES